ncbi:MAG: endolytic transglycosylase MltG [Ruminococcus sp.]|nr:endolytic transglycosylase MltG [Ruminococcus sp.]
MSYDNNEEKKLQEQLEEQRRNKVKNFKLNIQNDIYDEPASADINFEPEELTSYSGEDVKQKMAKDSRHALKKKKKEEKKLAKAKNKKNKGIFRIFWLVAVLIIGSMIGMFAVSGINDMLAINRTEETTVKIEIPENPDLDMVTEVLVKNKVIKEEMFFKLFAIVTKSDDDFTQGTYEIPTNKDYEAVINFLLSSSNRQDVISVTIPEGLNVREIANTLKENGAISDVDKFLELCNSDNFDEDYDFIKAIPNKQDRYYKLEGYLYPDTYLFYKNQDPEDVIYTFLNNFESRYDDKQDVEGYDKRVEIDKMLEESDHSLDEIMIIASIIQAEAANTEDMYYVSSILHNRLDADVDLGVSNLGLDSTRFYPYRTYEEVPEDVRDSYISAYDTYDKAGLPSGEICNPGMNAILAAINPHDTDYYFFCHDSEGNAHYASDIYEHNLNLEYYVD